MPTCWNLHVCTDFSSRLDVFITLSMCLYCICVSLSVCVCVCTSPLSCQSNLRLSNRISAAWWRFMPTLGLLIRRSLTDSHAWQTASFYRREGEREEGGGGGWTKWRWADEESERQTERREVDKTQRVLENRRRKEEIWTKHAKNEERWERLRQGDGQKEQSLGSVLSVEKKGKWIFPTLQVGRWCSKRHYLHVRIHFLFSLAATTHVMTNKLFVTACCRMISPKSFWILIRITVIGRKHSDGSNCV